MITNYIFDLYGTLIDIHTDEYQIRMYEKLCRYLEERNIIFRPEELRDQYFQTVKEEEHHLPIYGEIDLVPVFEKIAPGYAQEFAYMFRTCSMERLRLFPDTEKVLQELKEAGKHIYLLSNAQACFTVRELQDTGLYPYFDDIFISSETGYKKPSPLFMKALLDKHHLLIPECVMIGNDFTTDIQTACDFGMRSVFLNTDGHTDDTVREMMDALNGDKDLVSVIPDGRIRKLGEHICLNG